MSIVFNNDPRIVKEVFAVIETDPINHPGLESSLFITDKLTEGLETEVAVYDNVEAAKQKMESLYETLAQGKKAFVAARGYDQSGSLVDIHWFI